MDKLRINVGELRRTLAESQNEFKPKMFGHEESKKINDKAYKDMTKQTSEYNGGIQARDNKKAESDFTLNDNKGMHDLRYDNTNDAFKKRVQSQMKGYASEQAEKLHKNEELGNGQYDKDGKILKAAKDHAKRMKDGRVTASEIGLTGREISRKSYEDLNDTVFESKKIKRLSFKKTKFLNEDHVLSRVPDELKTEGSRFIMRDSENTEYLVEWTKTDPIVTKKLNRSLVEEEKQRIKQLWEYNSKDHEVMTNCEVRLNEQKEFSNVLNKVRKLMQ